MNIELSSGSNQTASFWSEVMSRVCENIPYASFREKPDNVISVGGEYYTDGTYSYVKKRTTKTKSSETETSEETTTQAPTTEAPTTAPSSAPATEATTHESSEPATESTH